MQWGAFITVVLYIKKIDILFVVKTDTFVLLNMLFFVDIKFTVVSKKQFLIIKFMFVQV